MSTADTHPSWWSPKHTSAWDRTKEAIRRDWEQTKHDLTGGGHDLNQDARETLQQASGKAPSPLGNVPNAPDARDHARHAKANAKAELKSAKTAAAADVDAAKANAADDVNAAKMRADADIKAAGTNDERWNRSERAVRYGFGAAMEPNREWSTHKGELQSEWNVLDGGRSWDDAEDDVRYGWEGARKSTTPRF